MKQNQYSPMTVSGMALSLYAVENGYFDDVEVNKIVACETAMQAFVSDNAGDLLNGIEKSPKLTDEVKEQLDAALNDFKANGAW
jgi:F-type H+/Na+-transporting ATPase subunit alpha